MATRRRGRALIFVAVILILLLVLVVAGWQFVVVPLLIAPQPQATQVAVNTPTPVPDLVYIVMTAQRIPRGAYLTTEALVLVPMPRADYVEGTFIKQDTPPDPTVPTVIDDLVANRMRAGMDLKERIPLTMEMLIGEEGNPSSFSIPRGMVAISIPISKLSSVSYGLQPGDHVNVIATLRLVDIDPNFQAELPNRTASVTLPGRLVDQSTGVAVINDGGPEGDPPGVAGRGEFDPTLGTPIYVFPREEQRPRLVSQTLIQDTIVLQMGIFAQGAPQAAQPTPQAAEPAQPAPQDQAQPTPAPQTTIPVPDVITLIVSPQDAVTLNYLMLAGAQLNLVMRSAGDTDIVQTEAVTLQFVMDQYGIPNPAKLPYGMDSRADREEITGQNAILPFPESGTPVPSLPTATPAP